MAMKLDILDGGHLDEVANLAAALPGWDVSGGEIATADSVLIANSAVGPEAACAIWHSAEFPSLDGKRLGRIGLFAAKTFDSAKLVLDAACQKLASAGCASAIGPMNGTTWHRYRFVTDSNDTPPFFMEPANPREYPEWWIATGFEPLATYFSSAVPDLRLIDPRLERTRARLAEQGVTIRPFRLEAFDEELKSIYEISVASFTSNFLYTPLPYDAFAAMYEKVRAYIVPQFARIAEAGGTPVGYVFAIPDYSSPASARECVIVKTVAIRPSRQSAGLGNVLVADIHTAADALGFRRGIHALMHESNNSLNLSARYGKAFRNYTLFRRHL
jgi:L-amino acid N-acyltransferase YncA